MQRILLLLVCAAFLTLPASAAARRVSKPASSFLVVHDASTDNVATSTVGTVVVRGFVIGHIAQEGAVELYHPGSLTAGQAAGVDVFRRQVTWHGVPGIEFSGSDFRFRAVGGVWRVVVHGAGVSLYAGGQGSASLRGSVAYPDADGEYSVDGGPFVSLPSGGVKLRLGAK